MILYLNPNCLDEGIEKVLEYLGIIDMNETNSLWHHIKHTNEQQGYNFWWNI